MFKISFSFFAQFMYSSKHFSKRNIEKQSGYELLKSNSNYALMISIHGKHEFVIFIRKVLNVRSKFG